MEKEIKVLTLEVGELKFGFGNPRKISSKKKSELMASLERLGDFGLFLIDEECNVIGGTQRAKLLQSKDPHIKVTCKMLIGYSTAELRAINIMDNTSAGEWELDLLADWTADLNLTLGISEDSKEEVFGREIKEMELIHYERYDYVLIACRTELDYNDLVRKLGIEGMKVAISKRKIKGRAIWYDKMKADIVPKE